MTLTNRVSEYPSSPGIRVNRRSTDDSISSPYHGHSYTDISPNEPDNDSDDHHPHHQQNRTTKTESNRVSFGSNNSGAQVGINHGPITYNNSSENYANEYHQSSGGQIFNGDITAGRDIHIDNTINKVYSLFQSTAHAPKMINQAQNELGMLNTVLTVAAERFRECNVTEGERKTLNAVLKSCDEASMELSQLKERFEQADEQSQANLERFGLGLEEVKDIRRTLTMNIQILNALTTEISRSSQANVERLLRKYAGEFENGKRDISRYSQESLAEDESEIWRQVRKDLQIIGITAESFRKNHALIVSTLRDLLPEIGALSTEDIRRVPHVAKSMNPIQKQLLENELRAAASGDIDLPKKEEHYSPPPHSQPPLQKFENQDEEITKHMRSLELTSGHNSRGIAQDLRLEPRSGYNADTQSSVSFLELGKSDILKQIKPIQKGGYSRAEREALKVIIHNSVLSSMRQLLEGIEVLGIELEDSRNEYHVQVILQQPKHIRGDRLPPRVGEGIEYLWRDEGVQEGFKRSHEFQLNESAEYFFDAIVRIDQPDYLPTDRDLRKLGCVLAYDKGHL